MVTSCCYGNNCNNPSGSGVKCIDSDGSIKEGCKYCQVLCQDVLLMVSHQIQILSDNFENRTFCPFYIGFNVWELTEELCKEK